MRQINYITLEEMQTLWENLEYPCVFHFDCNSINICKKSKLFFIEMAEKYERRDVKFFNILLKEEDLIPFFEAYGVTRFPAMLIYDYGEILFRWNSFHDMNSEFEICIQKALTNV